MTKETLEQYRELGKEVKDLERHIRRLERQALSPAAHDGMPRGAGKGDRTGNLAAKIGDLRTKLEEKQIQLLSLQGDIEDAIGGLKSRERRLMRLRYIEGYSWRKVGFALNRSEDRVKHVHQEILEKILENDTL